MSAALPAAASQRRENARAAKLSIIIPVLDEATCIQSALQRLQPLRAAGHEIIVVDGGSRDDTVRLTAGLADCCLQAARGRAMQMNAGAARARWDVLVFLHADTVLPRAAPQAIVEGLANGRSEWGRFDVRIDSRRPTLKLVARMMTLRSRLTGICTGDQAIFVRRETFGRIGGFPAIALMEDIALSKALRRCSAPLALRVPVLTSARRWEKHGIWRTILLMWRLRLRYVLGASPQDLRRAYDGDSR